MLLENLEKLVKIRPVVFLILEHHFDNFGQFFVLSAIVDIRRVLRVNFIWFGLGSFPSDQLVESQTETVDVVLVRIRLDLVPQFTVSVHFLQFWRQVKKTSCNAVNVVHVGTQSEVYQFASQSWAHLDEIFWLNVSMDDILVLEKCEQFSEVKCEIYDLVDGKFVTFLFDEFEK